LRQSATPARASRRRPAEQASRSSHHNHTYHNHTSQETNVKHPLRSALAAAALTLAFCSPSMAQEPIKIGFIGTLSGPTAAVGQDQLDGFKLFLDMHDGKLGGVPIQLLQEDSQ